MSEAERHLWITQILRDLAALREQRAKEATAVAPATDGATAKSMDGAEDVAA